MPKHAGIPILITHNIIEALITDIAFPDNDANTTIATELRTPSSEIIKVGIIDASKKQTAINQICENAKK